MSKKKYPPYHIYPGTIDSHTHLLHMDRKGIDVKSLLEHLKREEFSYILDAGVHENDFESRVALKEHYPDLFFSAGIHPEGAEGDIRARIEVIKEQLKNSSLIAVGEIGLDYYWKDRDPLLQKELFAAQLTLAAETNLPVIIHNREADDDCLELISGAGLPRGGVMHCFSSTKDFARKVLDLDFYISFAGNVTYKNALDIQEAAAYIPRDRILIETDAPYLSPNERRGRPNHPGHLGYTIDFLSNLRHENTEQLINDCRKNFRSLFLFGV